jgi:serine/threonine protein kinase
MSMRDYEVIKELGSGAFGTVVLVKQGSTKYCVKKVDVRRMPRKERDAAVAEARVLKKFNHPNIVQYKDQFIEDGTLCIVVRDLCCGIDRDTARSPQVSVAVCVCRWSWPRMEICTRGSRNRGGVRSRKK